MTHFIIDPPGLVHGRGFGKLGQLKSVISFYGWEPMTDVGQQIDWCEETCLIQITAPYVTNRRKQSITSSPHVSSPIVFFLLQRVGLDVLSPQPSETSFDDWWCRTSTMVGNAVKKGFNSLIILLGRCGGTTMSVCSMEPL
jgi:hypothetical protein